MSSAEQRRERGPFIAKDLREGRYELSEGHPIYCEAADGQHGSMTLIGSLLLATDPDVEEAGVDIGFTGEDPGTLRAPDVAIGNVPTRPGWVRGAPALGVEYAGTRTDEADLQKKIGELLANGTRLVWVARLVGPRRVEVYEKDQPVRIESLGGELRAPGILRNAVPVAALFDRRAAFEVTLRNLLQRKGYADLDAVLEQGREEGREQGREEGREQGREEGAKQALLAAIETLCEVLAIPLGPEQKAELSAARAADLRRKLERLRAERAW